MRILRVAIAVLLIAVAFVYGAPSHAETAEEMLCACRPISQAKVSDGRIDLPQSFDAGSCWGAFAALHQAMMLVESDGKPSLHVCLPEDSTRTQLIAVFVRYVEKHVEVYPKNFAVVALNAELEAFPCKKTP